MAVYGHGYGAYVALLILAADTTNIFRCAIAVSPITKWEFYSKLVLLFPPLSLYFHSYYHGRIPMASQRLRGLNSEGGQKERKSFQDLRKPLDGASLLTKPCKMDSWGETGDTFRLGTPTLFGFGLILRGLKQIRSSRRRHWPWKKVEWKVGRNLRLCQQELLNGSNFTKAPSFTGSHSLSSRVQ